MSATDFLPRREASLRIWSINFNATIAADPTAYGLTALQAADYGAKHDTFVAAYQAANEPSTRTAVSIIAKNDAVRALRAEARRFSGIIQATRSVSDDQKSSLGLTMRRAGGKQPPISRPSHAPNINILSTRGNILRIRLSDPASPTRRGKPTGVEGATILSFVGQGPPADLSDWKFEANTSRSVLEVTFKSSISPGAKVWLTAMWFNPRGQAGPPSAPIGTHIQGGLAAAAAA